MPFTTALRGAAALVTTAGALGLATLAGRAVGQEAGTYGVACADAAYFERQTRNSPVEFYLRINEPGAARTFLRRMAPATPHKTADAVILLYNPHAAQWVGVVPFAGGCARQTGFMSDKRQVDQMLAGMLHEGLID